jgi:hypothetical protein
MPEPTVTLDGRTLVNGNGLIHAYQFSDHCRKPRTEASSLLFTAKDRKYHNFRILRKGMQSFYRTYFHIKKLWTSSNLRCTISLMPEV